MCWRFIAARAKTLAVGLLESVAEHLTPDDDFLLTTPDNTRRTWEMNTGLSGWVRKKHNPLYLYLSRVASQPKQIQRTVFNSTGFLEYENEMGGI